MFLEELQKTNHFIRHFTAKHDTSQPILRLANVSVRYETYTALDRISFEVHTGERLAVVGPNGAGKSTLFKVIAGVLAPSEGEVHVYGHEPGGHICIAYLTQRSLVDWNFPVTVADVVMMGRIGQIGLFRRPKKQDWEKVDRALAMVGLSNLAKRQISQLSGGQQQRMFIARALAQQAELILMDEPFTGLDPGSQEDILDILEELQAQEVTVLVATHDLEMASTFFDRALLLNHKLVAIGKAEEVFSAEKLMTAYSGHLRLANVGDGLLALADTCCDEDHHTHD